MSRINGDFVLRLHKGTPTRLSELLGRQEQWPPRTDDAPIATLAPAPGVEIMLRGDVRAIVDGSRGGIGLALHPLRNEAKHARHALCEAGMQAWLRGENWSPSDAGGRYLLAFWDAGSACVTAFSDAFRTLPLYYAVTGNAVYCASDLRLLLAARQATIEVDPVAVFHYMNFAYVPAPRCVVQGVSKLLPGHRLEASPGRVTVTPVWDASYAEDLRGDDQELASQLREEIVSTIRSYRPHASASWGTFLSGGTDSSSINGILAAANGSIPVKSFSIGFSEAGYDELAYADIAARHFGLQAQQMRVSESDAVTAIMPLAAAFDEPFGNSSAIPTYYCAHLARGHGVDTLVAGDGGDEIFGGNERYRKDKIFSWYYHAPTPVRAAGALAAQLLGPWDARIPNRLKNFVHRGSLPNPDRFYSDDSFASDHYAELLNPDFRNIVGRDDSLEFQRSVYRRAPTSSELHRIMYLDLKMTIAESDIVKVARTSKLAGVDVVFPFLDTGLIEFTGRLPEHFKVKGLNKRYLFKMALEDILPIEIRKKPKQGFGLPMAVWLRRGGPMRDMLYDIVLSPRALSRGYFDPSFVRTLTKWHEKGAWDYSTQLYQLLMLELWHRKFADADS